MLTGFMRSSFTIVLSAVIGLFPAAIASSNSHWKSLADGVQYATFAIDAEGAAGILHVVRIDPGTAALGLWTAGEHGGKSRTAGEWCDDFGLVAAINAGMYQMDMKSNVGYMRNGDIVNQGRWNTKYQSVFLAGPRKKSLPQAILRDMESGKKKAADYHVVIQNLRLIKDNGRNVWAKQEKKWSEAAVGIDAEGRILFLFCREPMSMWTFNERIKALSLQVLRAMHVEGGPEASLSIRAREFRLDRNGGFATGVIENGVISRQWPIPNVIGIRTGK